MDVSTVVAGPPTSPLGWVRPLVSNDAKDPVSALQAAFIVSCSSNWSKVHGPDPVYEEADVQLDVGHLRNPFKEDHLRDLGGLDEPTQAFVREQPGFPELWDRLLADVRAVWATGEAVATVAIRCKGGHDRSVAIAQMLREEIRTWPGCRASVEHRHLYRRHPWVPESLRVGR
jgi:UPF0042 nucleotide-binding protein